MAEDTNEHLGSYVGSSDMNTVAWLRIMAALLADDGKPHAVMMQASDRLEQLQRAAVAVLEWYFRDGSVGGAEDPMYELMRSCGVTEEWLRRK